LGIGWAKTKTSINALLKLGRDSYQKIQVLSEYLTSSSSQFSAQDLAQFFQRVPPRRSLPCPWPLCLKGF